MALDLAGRLRSVAPSLPPQVGAVIAAVAVLLTAGPHLLRLVEQAQSPTLRDRIDAAEQLRTAVFNYTIHGVWDSASQDLGLNPAQARQQARDAFRNLPDLVTVDLAAPVLNSMDAAVQWISDWQDAFNAGIIDQPTYDSRLAHYQSELARILGGGQVAAIPGGFVGQPSTIPGGDSAAIAAAIQGLPSAITAGLSSTGLGSLPGVLSGAGVGTLAGSLAQALAQNASLRGHDAQQGRYSCMPSFLPALGNAFARWGPQLAAGAVLFQQDDLRQLLFGSAEPFVSSQLNIERFPGPADEKTAQAVAVQRVAEAVHFGRQASLLALSMEGLTPMKNMGFTQYAGLLAEFAGFDRLAQGLMGTVEQAAMIAPLRWAANRRFRPTLPGDQVTTLMFQKRSLTEPELRDILERQGFPELYISRIKGFIYQDPRLGEIVRVGQLAPLVAPIFTDEDKEVAKIANIDLGKDGGYLRLKLAKAGYDPTDVEAFVVPIQMGLVRREQTLRYGALQRLYRDGFITRERTAKEIVLAQQPAPVAEYRLAAMDLDLEYELKSEDLDLALAAMSRGLVSEQEVRTHLVEQGLAQERIDRTILRERLGMVRRSTLAVPKSTEEGLIETEEAP